MYRRSTSSRCESAESLPANGRRPNSNNNGMTTAYRTGRQASSAEYGGGGANSSPIRGREGRLSSAGTPRLSGLANVSDDEFHFWRRLSSRPGRIIMMFLILLPFVIVSVGLILAEPDLYLNGCYGCAFSPAGLYVLVFTSVAAFIFAAITSWRIRHFPDPYGVVQECRWGFLYGGLPAILFFVLDKWEPHFR